VRARVISLATAKPARSGEIDLILAKHGINRAWVEATFAQQVANEDDVPEVAHLVWMLKAQREFRPLVEEMAASAQAELAEHIK